MRQSGFTLVEVAIALVIAGLVLGGLLRTEALVYSARAKSLARDFRTVPVYLYQYQDRFRALPGDDAAAPVHLPGAQAAPAGHRGNGVIEAAWNAADPTAESYLFWQHVRLANLAEGPTDPADPLYTPRNAMGGAIGISSAAPAQLQVAGMRGDFQVCSSAIPGKLVRQLDGILDDADTANGSVRAVPDGSPLNSAAIRSEAIVDNDPYTVCMTF